MWFVTGQIRGDGDSRRQQSPEFLLVNLGISTASFYKHCRWQWPSDSRLMWVGCSRWSEASSVLVSPYLEMLDSDLEVSCLLLTQQASTQRFNWCTGSMTPSEIWYKVYWLATIDPCVADSPENLPSLLKRLILMTYTRKVILPQSHWEVYWLAFLRKRGAIFIVKEGLIHCELQG